MAKHRRCTRRRVTQASVPGFSSVQLRQLDNAMDKIISGAETYRRLLHTAASRRTLVGSPLVDFLERLLALRAAAGLRMTGGSY